MKGIGIDFGTSNSAAAIFDGTEIRLIEIEPGMQTVPTAIHIDRDFQTLTGSIAIETYVSENSERRVEITAKAIGEAALDVSKVLDGPGADGDDSRFTVYGPAEDYGLPGRLFLGIKRLLGKEQIKRLMVFERPFRLVALVTPILLSIRKAIQSAAGNLNSELYVGRPVEFEGRDPGKNTLATDRIQEACTYAQLGDVVFYPEPVAACLSFVHKENIASDSTILTVDFGGGTLDLCLVYYQDNSFKVLGTEGIPIGGDYIDQLIYQALIFPALGRDIMWSRTVDGRLIETAFPFDQYEQALLNWTITHTLNQNKYLARIHEFIAQQGNSQVEKEQLMRLRDIILHNYSYLIVQEIKAAKAVLSEHETTVLDIPEINLAITFTRDQLNAIIAEVMESLQGCIDQLLQKAQIGKGEVNFVVRTGGSSKLVAVVELLDRLFPAKVVQHDIFTSVASGLAIASYYSYKY